MTSKKRNKTLSTTFLLFAAISAFLYLPVSSNSIALFATPDNSDSRDIFITNFILEPEFEKDNKFIHDAAFNVNDAIVKKETETNALKKFSPHSDKAAQSVEENITVPEAKK